MHIIWHNFLVFPVTFQIAHCSNIDRFKPLCVVLFQSGLRVSDEDFESKVTSNETSRILASVCDELERMFPNLYQNVSNRINVAFTNESVMQDAFRTVCASLFAGEITWGRIVSMYAIVGAISIDCARQERPNYLKTLTYMVEEEVLSKLGGWIVQQGGWVKTFKDTLYTFAVRFFFVYCPKETPVTRCYSDVDRLAPYWLC